MTDWTFQCLTALKIGLVRQLMKVADGTKLFQGGGRVRSSGDFVNSPEQKKRKHRDGLIALETQ